MIKLPKKYFMTTLEVLRRFCHVILEKAKDEEINTTNMENWAGDFINENLEESKTTRKASANSSMGQCSYHFVKGENVGQQCRKAAKVIGHDGTPRCTSHKNTGKSRSSKASSVPSMSKYDHSVSGKKGKPKVSIETLSEVLKAKSASYNFVPLDEDETKFICESTNFVFEKRDDEYFSVGKLNANSELISLTENDTAVCIHNGWKFDPITVQDNDNLMSEEISSSDMVESNLAVQKIANVLQQN